MTGQAIFISYRREDTMDACGRIYDRLAAAFGSDAIFRDIDTMPFGEDFRNHVVKTLEQCRVALILIGPSWMSTRDRLDDPDDPVRLEIEEANKIADLQLIPVLVSGARMPMTNELPEPIRLLARLNAPEVRRDPDFHRDMDVLIEALTNGQLSGFVKAGGHSSPAEQLWDQLSESFDPSALRNFADSFPGIRESYQARERASRLEGAIQSLDTLLDLARGSVDYAERHGGAEFIAESIDNYKAARDTLRNDPPAFLTEAYVDYGIGSYSRVIEALERLQPRRVQASLRQTAERERDREQHQAERKKVRASYVPGIAITAVLTTLCLWTAFAFTDLWFLWVVGVPFFGLWTCLLWYLRSVK